MRCESVAPLFIFGRIVWQFGANGVNRATFNLGVDNVPYLWYNCRAAGVRQGPLHLPQAPIWNFSVVDWFARFVWIFPKLHLPPAHHMARLCGWLDLTKIKKYVIILKKHIFSPPCNFFSPSEEDFKFPLSIKIRAQNPTQIEHKKFIWQIQKFMI